jgi:hypothetical protein
LWKILKINVKHVGNLIYPANIKEYQIINTQVQGYILHASMSHNVHAYVDDIIVKSKKSGGLIVDLTETFANLHKSDMKLYPGKCIFRVPVGKLLGFIFLERGIEVKTRQD